MNDQSKSILTEPEVAFVTKGALATPRINIIPATPKNLSPRGSIQAAIRLGAARHRATG